MRKTHAKYLRELLVYFQLHENGTSIKQISKEYERSFQGSCKTEDNNECNVIKCMQDSPRACDTRTLALHTGYVEGKFLELGRIKLL